MKLFLLIFVFIFAPVVEAAKTGNIIGYVYDTETGNPLPGANILIEATNYGATSNIKGFFEINDIPAGLYAIQATFIGYKKTNIIDVEVIADSTCSLEIRLTPEAIILEDITVTAQKPVIEKDVTATRSRFSKELSIESSSGAIPRGEGESKPRKPYASPDISGLRAGYADDNRQYNYFINFLEQYKTRVAYHPIEINERIHLKVRDESGKSIPNADIYIYTDDKIISKGKTYADGSFFFFPSLHSKDSQSYKAKYNYQQVDDEKVIGRLGIRNHDLPLKIDRGEFSEVHLDILFILDTTGSMGEEIERLKATIDLIHLNLISLEAKIKVRFGLVLYRDKNDEYVTRVVQLTDNMELFQNELKKVAANGGGDNPEDLQSALKVSLKEIDWNLNGIRLGFIITDAPPHLDYEQEYTYVDAIKEAKENGIKLFSVGTGGLSLAGEYILRQISQFTYAKYIFLTYGEKGESEGGKPGSVSHHTGSNYQTDKLEAIIIQFAREELSHLIDISLPIDDEYFAAAKIDDEKNEDTLNKLFTNALSQLVDYSSIKIDKNTTLAILPISPKDTSLELESEYFTEQLALSISNDSIFTLTERADLQKIIEEWKLQLSGIVSDSLTTKIGELMGANVLLIGHLFNKKNNYEIFLKLLRVETGELLAATKLKIDHRLGLI